ncbi:hypothetical protein [Buttiauxella brennerae]|uniref:hypothetical protein n=1 Tax=Buttiauxella brennerae TaxID=82988 RepID=UPI00286EFAC5|nr:hypothetical protein [Buttiauxella brennerae]
MAAATLEVNSDKRSNYPLRIIGFDLLALELLTFQRGHRLTLKGAYTWNNGYQLVVREIIPA